MRYVLTCFLPLLSFTICAQAWEPNTEIFGSLHQIMAGEANEKVKLNLMGPLTDHYGIGAVAGLDGEILIDNGVVYVSRVWNDRITLDKSSDIGVTLLVISEVPEWQAFVLGNDIRNLGALASFIQETAKNEGFHLNEAIPFRLQGNSGSIEWHVVSPEAIGSTNHKTSGKSGKYEGAYSAVGFFSLHHEGEFTHLGQYVHVHFLNDNKSITGHVDQIRMQQGDKLLLPNK